MRAYSFAAAGALAAAALAVHAGCSSAAKNTGPTCNPCDDGGGQVAGHDTNPAGVPYPSSGYGQGARVGQSPGSVIKNFKFLGYPNADATKSPQTIALADYYSPRGT